MDERLMHLWRTQRAVGFAGVAGARMAVTIPFTDEFLNEGVAAYLPAGGMIQKLALQSRAENRLTLVVTLAKPAFLPPIKIRAAIERQPDLPASPELILKLDAGIGLIRMLGPALAMLGNRAPGIRLEGERLHVDVRTLLREKGPWLDHVESLAVTTEEGRVVLRVTAVFGERKQEKGE